MRSAEGFISSLNRAQDSMKYLDLLRQYLAIPFFLIGGLFMLIAGWLAIDESDFQ